ncbi:Anaphase spindle elongation protein 1 [Colletotrichum chlorophyti]|uniref:Anaphase spindle elongation protein 1 n=1 Tax=Colletotrichum chlorophyti TaxID=708187 RepID=A0A1Q8RMX6_9PEZI|nr:Anaphase spindle elongation protein 1 [Colletotrichum chlorophyti]
MDTSYLSQQVNTIIGQLHGLFDDIGVPNHDREKREEDLFEALSKALTDQVRLVTSEKEEMIEEAERMITAIRQMEASIDDNRSRRDRDDDEMKITYPLTRCLQALKEKHKQVSRLHRERFEQVKKLVEALESYSSHLEATFVKIPLPPTGPNQSIPTNFDLSPAYVDRLDNEFTRVYEEYTRRVATVKALSEHIIQLWAELGTPQAQTDGAIVKYYRDAPEQLGLHEEDIARLKAKRDKLSDEKKNREKRLKDLRAAVEALWEKLEVDMGERKTFLNSNRGCGVRQINEFEDELARLNELKRQNLHLFVEDARCKLQELWDALYLSEDEMLEFTPAFSDVYSDALLEAHEREIARLEAVKEQRAPTLALIDKHKSLTSDRDELAASSQDASRLMLRGQKGEKRDPTRLLREEKMRKRIAKELPKVTIDLRKALERFEDEYGRPFLVHGERYLDIIEAEDRSAPGPRSKTPGAGAPASATRPKPGHTRANSTSSAVRPPTRNGARTPGPTPGPAPVPTTKRSVNNMNTASQGRPVSAHAKSSEGPRPVSSVGTLRERANTLNKPPGSPSRIPARAPLSNLKYGNNSPERLQRPESRIDAYATIRSGPMNRAPPPKMRDLASVDLETPENPYKSAGLGGSIVRQVELEDPYGDYQQPQLMRANSTLSHVSHTSHASHASHMSHASHHSHYSQQPANSSQYDYHSSTIRQHPPSYPQAPPPRQISNSSTGSSNVTGSENWETYDDASEPEQDATDTYYAKVRAARGKRFEPDTGYRPTASDSKRPRPFPTQYVDVEGNRIISGSEWTDEDGY